VVVSLGFGMLGSGPAQAGTIIGETLTVAGSSTSASSSVTQGDTATVTVVTSFTPEVAQDSMLVTTSCAAPSGGSCYNLLDFFWTETTDSTSVTSVTTDGSGTSLAINTDDSFIVTGSTAGQAVRFTASLKFRAAATTTAGVYTVTVYTKSSNAGAAPAVTATNKSVTWTHSNCREHNSRWT